MIKTIFIIMISLIAFACKQKTKVVSAGETTTGQLTVTSGTPSWDGLADSATARLIAADTASGWISSVTVSKSRKKKKEVKPITATTSGSGWVIDTLGTLPQYGPPNFSKCDTVDVICVVSDSTYDSPEALLQMKGRAIVSSFDNAYAVDYEDRPKATVDQFYI